MDGTLTLTIEGQKVKVPWTGKGDPTPADVHRLAQAEIAKRKKPKGLTSFRGLAGPIETSPVSPSLSPAGPSITPTLPEPAPMGERAMVHAQRSENNVSHLFRRSAPHGTLPKPRTRLAPTRFGNLSVQDQQPQQPVSESPGHDVLRATPGTLENAMSQVDQELKGRVDGYDDLRGHIRQVLDVAINHVTGFKQRLAKGESAIKIYKALAAPMMAEELAKNAEMVQQGRFGGGSQMVQSVTGALSGVPGQAATGAGEGISQMLGNEPGAYLDTGVRQHVEEFANTAAYFIPGIGPMKIANDLVGVGARALEVGPKKAGGEFVEGLIQSANFLDPKATWDQKALRGLNAVLLGLAGAHGVRTLWRAGKKTAASFKAAEELNVTPQEAHKLLEAVDKGSEGQFFFKPGETVETAPGAKTDAAPATKTVSPKPVAKPKAKQAAQTTAKTSPTQEVGAKPNAKTITTPETVPPEVQGQGGAPVPGQEVPAKAKGRPKTKAQAPQEEVAPTPEAGGVKEPWEMTRGELRRQGRIPANPGTPKYYESLPDYDLARLVKAGDAGATIEAVKRSKESGYRSPTQWDNAINKAADDLHASHKQSVATAISEGKPVPPEVLADYPDLAAKPASPNTIVTDEAYAAAKEALRKKMGQANSGVDPEIIQHLGVMGAYWVERGARTFAAFSERAIAELGDAVKPHLEEAWKRIAPTEQQRPATGLANVVQQAEGIGRTGRGAKEGFAQSEGKAAVESGQIDPHALATELAAKPRPVSNVEVGALLEGKRGLMLKVKDAAEKADAARAAGSEDADALAQAYKDAKVNLNDFVDKAQNGKTALSDAFRALQEGVNIETGDYHAVLAEFERIRVREASTKEKAQLKDLTDRLTKANVRIAALERKRHGEVYEGQAKQVQRTTQKSKLDTELIDLQKRKRELLARTSANPFADPELYLLAKDFIVHYAKRGVLALDELIGKIKSEFPNHNLSDQDVIDMAHEALNPQKQKLAKEATAERAKLKKELRDLNSGAQEKAAKADQLKIESEAQQISAQQSEVLGAAKTDRAKMKARQKQVARLTQRIADLGTQIETGAYRRPSPKPTVLDSEVSALRDRARALAATIKRAISEEDRGFFRPFNWIKQGSREMQLFNPFARLRDIASNVQNVLPTGMGKLDQAFGNAAAKVLGAETSNLWAPGKIKYVQAGWKKRWGIRMADDWRGITEGRYGSSGPASKAAGMFDEPFRDFHERGFIYDLASARSKKGLSFDDVFRQIADPESHGPLPNKEAQAIHDEARMWGELNTYNNENLLSKTLSQTSSAVRRHIEDVMGKGGMGTNTADFVDMASDVLTRFSKVIGNVALESATYANPYAAGVRAILELGAAKRHPELANYYSRRIGQTLRKGLVGYAALEYGRFLRARDQKEGKELPELFGPVLVQTKHEVKGKDQAGSWYMDEGAFMQLGGISGAIAHGYAAKMIEDADISDSTKKTLLNRLGTSGIVTNIPAASNLKRIQDAIDQGSGADLLANMATNMAIPGFIREWARTQDRLRTGVLRRQPKVEEFGRVKEDIPFVREQLKSGQNKRIPGKGEGDSEGKSGEMPKMQKMPAMPKMQSSLTRSRFHAMRVSA